MQRTVVVSCLSLLTGVGCVSTAKYNTAVDDAAKANAALAAERAAKDRAAHDLDGARADLVGCHKELDDATAVNQELNAELKRLGTDAEQLLAAKGALATSLDQARARLDELRKAQAAAEARSALFRELALKLKKMIDAGDLKIVLRSGRMVLVLPNDVLFDSGKAEIKPRGKETVKQIASVLATIPSRRFQVAGHTDNEPIRVSGFESNWRLSTERALEVVTFLVQSGMRPETLSAAGYGEFDPVAPNTSPDGKTKNRRIEITLQPNIDELVAVPQGAG